MSKYYLLLFILIATILAQQYTDKELDSWLANLKHRDVNIKIHAIKKLQKHRVERAVPALLAALYDTDSSVRQMALNALQKIDRDVFPYAQKIYAKNVDMAIGSLSSSPKNRTRAISQLVNLGGISVLGTSADFRQGLKYEKRHALLIGINNYDNYGNLNGPHFDAAAIALVLKQRYGFEKVVLLVDKNPDNVDTSGITISVKKITREVIRRYLDKLVKSVSPQDALFFFYAGHGVPGHIVASNSTKKSFLSLTNIASKLHKAKAHHTLMVLDCCFSGSLLQGHYRPQFLDLAKKEIEFGGGNNLSRVFRRRTFQVITAGAGSEAVADTISALTRYAKLTKDSQGHSPFTAVFLQALRGLTGREDGVQLASDLGYYMGYQLVNDKRIEASQAPRYGSLGGEGDFMFFPAHKVLNPKLLAPLYLTDKKYAQMRSSGCTSLLEFILQTPKKEDRIALARSAIPHVVKLLEPDSYSQRAAMAFINKIAQSYGKEVTQLRMAIPLLTALLEQKKPYTELVAKCLGSLHIYANSKAERSFEKYLIELRRNWERKISSMPQELLVIINNQKRRMEKDILQIKQSANEKSQKILCCERERLFYEWFEKEAPNVLKQHQRQLQDRYKKGKWFVETARKKYQQKDYFAAKFISACALGFLGESKDFPPLLRQGSREWQQALDILNEEKPSISLEKSSVAQRHHSYSIHRLLAQKNTLVSVDKGNNIKVWRKNKLAYHLQKNIAVVDVALSQDAKTLAVLFKNELQIWDVDRFQQTHSFRLEQAQKIQFTHSNDIYVLVGNQQLYCYPHGDRFARQIHNLPLGLEKFVFVGINKICSVTSQGEIIFYHLQTAVISYPKRNKNYFPKIKRILPWQKGIVCVQGKHKVVYYEPNKVEVVLAEHHSSIYDVAIYNHQLLTITKNGELCIFDIKNQSLINNIFLVSPTFAIAATNDHYFLGTKSGKIISSKNSEQAQKISFSISGNRKLLAVVYNSKRVELWNAHTLMYRKTLPLQATDVAFHPSKNVLAFSTDDGRIGMFLVKENRVEKYYHCSDQKITRLQWCSNCLLIRDDQKTLFMWSKKQIKALGRNVTNFIIHGDSFAYKTTTGIKICTPQQEKHHWRYENPMTHRQFLMFLHQKLPQAWPPLPKFNEKPLKISQNKSLCIATFSNGQIQLWKDADLLTEITTESSIALQVLQHDSLLYTLHSDQCIRKWRIHMPSLKQEIHCPFVVSAVCFTNKKIIAGDNKGFLHRYHSNTSKWQIIKRCHLSAITMIKAFDNHSILTASSNGEICLHKTNNEKRIQTKQQIEGMFFVGDVNTILVDGKYSSKIWNLNSGMEKIHLIINTSAPKSWWNENRDTHVSKKNSHLQIQKINSQKHYSFPLRSDFVTCIVDNSGEKLAVVYREQVEVWQPTTFRRLCNIPVRFPVKLAFSKNSQELAVAQGNAIKICKVKMPNYFTYTQHYQFNNRGEIRFHLINLFLK
ncbi:caspase family protein [Candidatus Uabimicrobium amorphum]|nr:caspase family protein [Candidatus Uabimicrobium amorphum]